MKMANRRQARRRKSQVPVASGASRNPPGSLLSRTSLGAVAALIAIVAIVTYRNSLSTPFIFDDIASIPDNPTIRQLWPLSQVLSPPARGESVSGRPIVNLSLAINYALGGLDVRGYHLTNIAIHVLCALLVFGILRRTLALKNEVGVPPPLVTGLSVAVALIWMVHPLQSQAVTYVIGRTESLMALFYLLTLYASIRGLSSARWSPIAVISCALGMASKEAMVSAPLMVACYDRVFVFGSWREALRSRWRLYAGLAATWVVLALLIWRSPRAHSAGFQSSEQLGQITSPWIYLLNQAVMITRYLRLTFWPRDLVLDYGFIRPLTIGDVLPEIAFVGVLAAAAMIALIRWPRAGFAGLWFFVTLAPSSSIVPVVTEVGAERRMYLPSIAVITLVVLVASWLTRYAGVMRSRAPSVAMACVCVLLMVTTMARNAEYASELVMWQSVVDRWPGGRAHRNLAVALQAAGRNDEVIPHLREAVRDFPDAHHDLGAELLERGAYDEAIRELEQFLRDRPTHAGAAPAKESIGQAHTKLGDAAFDRGNYPTAESHYRAFVDLYPERASGWQSLGIALAALDRIDEAIIAFERAVALDPENGDARKNLAMASLTHRDFKKAAEHAGEAVRLRPSDPVAHDLLGLSLAALDRPSEAARAFREALAIDPGNEEIRAHLAAVAPAARGR
jgi:tetratricopeptide (TPR) repeat protein